MLAIGGAWVQAHTVRVKLPEVITPGAELRVLHYSSAWGAMFTNNTSSIVLKNGGAYAAKDTRLDPSQYTNFIPDGTMKPGEWYTVKRIIDIRTPKVNKQRVFVYNSKDELVGQNDGWWVCGDLTPAEQTRFRSMSFLAKYFAISDVGMIDSFNYWKINVIPPEITKTIDEDNYRKMEIGFDEPMMTSTMTKENTRFVAQNEDFDASGLYGAAFDAENQKMLFDFGNLPYDECYNVGFSQDVCTADDWRIDNLKPQSFTTKKDPFKATTKIFSNDNAEKTAVKTGDEIKANVTFDNPSDRTRDYLAILSVFDDKSECIEKKVVTGIVNPNESNILVQTPTLIVGEKAKKVTVQVWNNWKDMWPVSDMYEISAN